MPLKFWDEAFLTAMFLINRLPSRIIQNTTPHERLLSKKPDYSFLRTFGCACWPNLRPYNTKKLQFRSKQCVFLGYNNSRKGFKCLDPSEGRVYISRDIVFDESVFPFSALHPNAGAQLRAEILLLPDSLKNSTSFGDANLHDQHDTNPASNMSPSSARSLEDAGTNRSNFDEETASNAAPTAAHPRYFMCFSGGNNDNGGTNLDSDPSGARQTAQHGS